MRGPLAGSPERGELANNGAGRTFSDVELAAFRTKLEVWLKSAIRAACVAGPVPGAAAKVVKTVEAISASGATEPRLYVRDDDRLALEWTFAEEGLAVPSAKDIVAGAVCWTNPAEAACASEGD
jgi:hypothetical protein